MENFVNDPQSFAAPEEFGKGGRYFEETKQRQQQILATAWKDYALTELAKGRSISDIKNGVNADGAPNPGVIEGLQMNNDYFPEGPDNVVDQAIEAAREEFQRRKSQN